MSEGDCVEGYWVHHLCPRIKSHSETLSLLTFQVSAERLLVQSELRPLIARPALSHHKHYKVSPKSSQPLQGHHNHYKVSTTITRSALCHHNHHKVSIHTVAFPVFCSLCLTRSNNLTTNSGGLWEFQNRAHFLATSRTACDCPMEGGIQWCKAQCLGPEVEQNTTTLAWGWAKHNDTRREVEQHTTTLGKRLSKTQWH